MTSREMRVLAISLGITSHTGATGAGWRQKSKQNSIELARSCCSRAPTVRPPGFCDGEPTSVVVDVVEDGDASAGNNKSKSD
jgi:TPP-dependent indolepyruvate ferredoxin oxidoreductase alpha subunit